MPSSGDPGACLRVQHELNVTVARFKGRLDTVWIIALNPKHKPLIEWTLSDIIIHRLHAFNQITLFLAFVLVFSLFVKTI